MTACAGAVKGGSSGKGGAAGEKLHGSAAGEARPLRFTPSPSLEHIHRSESEGSLASLDGALSVAESQSLIGPNRRQGASLLPR